MLSKQEFSLLQGICIRCKSEGCSLETISDLLFVNDEGDPYLTKLIKLGFVRKDEPNNSHKKPSYKATPRGWDLVKH